MEKDYFYFNVYFCLSKHSPYYFHKTLILKVNAVQSFVIFMYFLILYKCKILEGNVFKQIYGFSETFLKEKINNSVHINLIKKKKRKRKGKKNYLRKFSGSYFPYFQRHVIGACYYCLTVIRHGETRYSITMAHRFL